VSVEAYTEWIQLVAQLTIDSLNSWQWAKDSVYYLLGLWSRCASARAVCCVLCAVLCAVLCCAVLCCAVLCCAVLCCDVM
jgi:hypothetical protein